MKKTLTTILLGGAVLASTASATQTFASTTDHGDGTQTVTGENKSSVVFVGNIGEFDPGTTDPGKPGVPGPGDDSWIKVKLPTEVAYYSTGSSKHQIIDSNDSEVVNESAYPVSVKLSGFTDETGAAPNTDYIAELKLVANNTIDLVSPDSDGDGVKEVFDNTTTPELFKLGANPNSAYPQDNISDAESKTFKFTGLTEGADSLKNQETVNNKLELTFVSLDADYNEVTP